jgi:hypothetical protein
MAGTIAEPDCEAELLFADAVVLLGDAFSARSKL